MVSFTRDLLTEKPIPGQHQVSITKQVLW